MKKIKQGIKRFFRGILFPLGELERVIAEANNDIEREKEAIERMRAMSIVFFGAVSGVILVILTMWIGFELGNFLRWIL